MLLVSILSHCLVSAVLLVRHVPQRMARMADPEQCLAPRQTHVCSATVSKGSLYALARCVLLCRVLKRTGSNQPILAVQFVKVCSDLYSSIAYLFFAGRKTWQLRSQSCLINGRVYQDQAQFKYDECTSCKCQVCK